MTDMPSGYYNTALCPLCNEISSARYWYQSNGLCPKCGKKIPRSCIIYAFSEQQSYQLARALQEERKDNPEFSE